MLQILDPTKIPDWDSLVLNTPGTGFFHSSAWCRVLAESYGYKPVYFAEIEGDRFKTLVPMMEIDSFITGKRAVSLPFTDYCQSMVNSRRPFHETLDEVAEYGRGAAWRSVELRSGDTFPEEVPSSCFYYGHDLDLTEGLEAVLGNFRDSTRRNVANALRKGVEAKTCRSLASVKEFYRLNCLTRRDHGLPPQPFPFFERLFNHIIVPGKGFVVLAACQGKNIAGAVFLHFGERGIFKYGASDKKFSGLRANNLVMWEAIKWYCDNGFRSFCFGRTEPDNEGLRQFKRGWGTEEHRIKYYKYDLAGNAFRRDDRAKALPYDRILRKMPIRLLNVIGSAAYKHMG